MNSVNKKILLLVLDTVPDGVHVASGEGITLNINKAFERITGVSRNRIVGGSIEEVVIVPYQAGTCIVYMMQKKT